MCDTLLSLGLLDVFSLHSSLHVTNAGKEAVKVNKNVAECIHAYDRHVHLVGQLGNYRRSVVVPADTVELLSNEFEVGIGVVNVHVDLSFTSEQFIII